MFYSVCYTNLNNWLKSFQFLQNTKKKNLTDTNQPKPWVQNFFYNVYVPLYLRVMLLPRKV